MELAIITGLAFYGIYLARRGDKWKGIAEQLQKEKSESVAVAALVKGEAIFIDDELAYVRAKPGQVWVEKTEEWPDIIG